MLSAGAVLIPDRLHAVDLITMAAMGAVGLGVYEADPAPSRSFPVFNLDGSIAYPQYVHTLHLYCHLELGADVTGSRTPYVELRRSALR